MSSRKVRYLIARRRARIWAARFENQCVGYEGDAFDRRRWRQRG
jgi:hypothetical protein